MRYGTTLLNAVAINLPMPSIPFNIFQNSTLKNRYAVGRFSDFNYADLEENFFKAPFDLKHATNYKCKRNMRYKPFITRHKTRIVTTLTLPKELTYNFSMVKKRLQKRNIQPILTTIIMHGY